MTLVFTQIPAVFVTVKQAVAINELLQEASASEEYSEQDSAFEYDDQVTSIVKKTTTLVMAVSKLFPRPTMAYDDAKRKTQP